MAKPADVQKIWATTVLVVDDNPDDICLLQLAALKISENVSFCSAKDAEEAKDYLMGKAHFADRLLYPLPRLILLDLSMRHGGAEFLDWLRRSPTFKKL